MAHYDIAYTEIPHFGNIRYRNLYHLLKHDEKKIASCVLILIQVQNCC